MKNDLVARFVLALAVLNLTFLGVELALNVFGVALL
jgi:hypothetical protein